MISLAVAATPFISMYLYIEPEMVLTDVIVENDGNLHANDTILLSFGASGMNVRDRRIHVTSTLSVYPHNHPRKTMDEAPITYDRKIADIGIEVRTRDPTVNISANFTVEYPGGYMVELSVIDWMRPKWREDSGPRQAFLYAGITVE